MSKNILVSQEFFNTALLLVMELNYLRDPDYKDCIDSWIDWDKVIELSGSLEEMIMEKSDAIRRRRDYSSLIREKNTARHAPLDGNKGEKS